ncbi:L-2-hydroxyglutarate oxidase [Aquicella lusitana]|uniref:L-2-hydroxyglutarate oxidase LhgO n=1 Tax=Aquicella lusitana TaxID=254246 RepID=A0A370GN27_9COXI|nr:L-2-hydroxyglutarate oxidase [Aquicella lusitana]RDI45135.1 L-2-hydroxyglutarate oxidase LhgO [Aquicella lusitana]VVC72795.1 L-2-hydroxyglutarate oxidase LhgO [Aquicella lusitana]
MHESEFLIVGAGIVGLALARELIEQGAERIIILEKESGLGFHASGRNSGVLHAGIYYPPNTLKAQLCLKGNLLLQDYCQQKGLPLVKAGKVIVARDESELPTLLQLHDRAKENGAWVEMVDEKQLASIEPNAKTVKQALYSHYTALIDNKAILNSLQQDLMQSRRVKFLFSAAFKSLKDEFTATTTKGNIRFKQFINTAGAHADRVAHHFGVGKDYYFIPFKGIYHKLKPEKAHLVNGNIYPVPHLGNPFLGVHFTKNINGDVYVGPTAIPAFGRENYGILQGIDREMLKIVLNEIMLYCVNPEFRKVALEEPKKYLPAYFYRDAKKLVKELEPGWLARAPKVGIRPQLISLRDKKLLMDFLVVKERHSLHILNAISPAFTSSMAFAKYIVREYFKGFNAN